MNAVGGRPAFEGISPSGQTGGLWPSGDLPTSSVVLVGMAPSAEKDVVVLAGLASAPAAAIFALWVWNEATSLHTIAIMFSGVTPFSMAAGSQPAYTRGTAMPTNAWLCPVRDRRYFRLVRTVGMGGITMQLRAQRIQ